jgi:hypothetical protein
MLDKLIKIFSGLRAAVKHEGIKSTISRGFMHIIHHLILVDNYYIHVGGIHEEPEEHYLPKVNNYCVRVISTNKEADELVAEGFDFGAYDFNLRATLDKGVSSICIFVDKELAHINCVAFSQTGKDVIDSHPFNVDFESGEAVGGRAITVPKYRRLGLRYYSSYLERKLYREKGCVRWLGTLGVKNYPALANSARYPYSTVVARCRYIKILWFKYTKETKIGPFTLKEILEQRSNSNKQHL